MTTYTPCLGGWCQRREQCQHYQHGSIQLIPVENLCNRVGREMFSPSSEIKAEQKEAA